MVERKQLIKHIGVCREGEEPAMFGRGDIIFSASEEEIKRKVSAQNPLVLLKLSVDAGIMVVAKYKVIPEGETDYELNDRTITFHPRENNLELNHLLEACGQNFRIEFI